MHDPALSCDLHGCFPVPTPVMQIEKRNKEKEEQRQDKKRRFGAFRDLLERTPGIKVRTYNLASKLPAHGLSWWLRLWPCLMTGCVFDYVH